MTHNGPLIADPILRFVNCLHGRIAVDQPPRRGPPVTGEVRDDPLRHLPCHQNSSGRRPSQVLQGHPFLGIGLARLRVRRSTARGRQEEKGGCSLVRLPHRLLPGPPHVRRRHNGLPSPVIPLSLPFPLTWSLA